MRKYILLLSVLGFMINSEIYAQFVKVTGSVVDRESDEPLPAATVKAILSNGSEETFAITNEKGIFNIELPRPGNYQFEFSYVSYNKMTKDANIRPGNNSIGKIRLKENIVELKESKIVGKNMRVRQIADTTVYNADGYKVMDGATAEELIKKMPGMNISDGKIEAQGEEVKKVLVDGKPFFENDPQLALKTLPAEVVQSIAIFDKKSDQAEFTGFDDGNTVKAIDVKTRSYKRNGMFGKVYGQYGTDDRYNVGGNVNYFSGERRITLLGLFNNVNQQNFSIDDILGTMSGPGPRGGGGGGGPMPPRQGGGMSNAVSSQSGISKTSAAGINYSDNWGDKVSVQGSYFFNKTNNNLTDSLNRAYFDTISGQRDISQVNDESLCWVCLTM